MTAFKTSLFTSAALALVLPPATAVAQDDLDQVETILVTARKKAEDLQDIPLSVAVVRGDELRQRVVTDLADFTDGTPSITVTRTPTSDAIYIRGVGSGTSVGFQQSVGTFVDGVYRGRGPAARTAFLGLERIEVLRGPQPVYFGNSTIGGAFNIVSRGPGDELEINAQSSYEFNAGEWVTEVGVGGPITDTLGVRFAYNHTESDGWLFDTIQLEETPRVNNDSFRGTVVFEPTDSFSATFKAEYSDNTENGGLLQVVDCNASLFTDPSQFGPNCNPGIFLTPGFEDDFDLNLSRDGTLPNGREQEDSNELEIWNISLNLSYDFDSGHTLTSVTGLVDYENMRMLDVDAGPSTFAQADRTEDFTQWSQEIRLESPSDGRLTYMVGVYYEDATLDYLEAPVSGAPPTSPLFPGFVSRSDYTQDQRTIAIFGSATYQIIETLSLTVGALWSDIDTDAIKVQRLFDLFDTPLTPEQIAAASAPGPNPRDEHDLPGSRSDADLNPAIELQWTPTNDVMLYASYKEGFKAGGFDPNLRLAILAEPTVNDENGGYEFDDETAKSWEIGAKTTLFDGTVTFNIAAFRTTFDDLQVASFDSQTNTFVTTNAGASRSQGIEIEGTWRATDWLNFNTSLTFLDSTFTEFDGAQCNQVEAAAFTPAFIGDQCVTSIDGQTTAFAPDLSGSTGFNLILPITDTLDFVSTGRVTYTTEYQWGQNPDPEEIQSGFAKIDLRAGISGNDGQWELAFGGKNLTDKLTFRFNGELPGGVGRFAQADRNRELGIQARFNY
ncbi:MAG: TonB-dependent receptor [Sphingomonadales bacterium]